MLPLSTIEGQETEEVQTKPPEKGGETHVGWELWAGGSGEVSRPWVSNRKYLSLAPLRREGPEHCRG